MRRRPVSRLPARAALLLAVCAFVLAPGGADAQTPTLTVEDIEKEEGKDLVFTVTLSGSTSSGFNVSIDTTGVTAREDVPNIDYRLGVERTIAFAGNDGEQKTFTVSTVDDTYYEDDETFKVSLFAHDSSVDASDTATGTIKNDDTASLTVEDVIVSESGFATFEVTLNNSEPRNLEVNVTLEDGNAIGGTVGEPGVDYDNTGHTLLFGADDQPGARRQARFTVTIADDDQVEGHEEFTVHLALAVPDPNIDVSDTAVGVITNNDFTSVIAAPSSQSEGDDLMITVTLRNALVRGFQVEVSFTDVTATGGTIGDPGVDYDNTPQTLTFDGTEGETRTLVVATADDEIVEGDEILNVLLSLTEENEFISVLNGTSIQILDNDVPAVTVTPTALDVVAGATGTYSVVLGTKPSADVTITTASDDAGAATVSPQSLTFTPSDWNVAQEVTVTGAGPGSAVISHAASGGGYGGVTIDDVAVTVVGSPNVGLVFSRTDIPVEEGSTASYTVALATEPSGEVSVAITGAGRGVSARPTLLTFSTTNWSTAQTVTVTAAEDSNTASETVTLAHAASGGGYDGVTGDVTVRTNDNDISPPGNRPPTVSAACDPCTVVPGGTVRLTATASDPDGDALTYAWSAPQGRFVGETGGAAASWVAPAAAGRVTLRVEVSDGRGGSASATVNVAIVRPSPPPPVVRRNRPPTVTAACDPCTVAPGGTVRLTATASDPDGDALTYAWSAPQGQFVGATGGTVARWVAPAAAGRVTLRVEVSDGRGGSASAAVDVVVVQPNRPPTVSAACDPCTVAAGGEVRLTATASDPDGDELTYAWSAPQGRFVGASAGAAARWVAPAVPGRVAIRVEVSDGRGTTASSTVAVDVKNEPPLFEQSSYAFQLRENVDGRPRPVGLGQVRASDPDGDELTYELASGDSLRFTIQEQDGVVTYVGPGEDFEAVRNRYELIARARDLHGAEAQARVVVTVTNVNEAPKAKDDQARTEEDKAVTVDVLANDTDPDRDALYIKTVSPPERGTTRLAPGGAGVVYSPEANYHGSDRFTYVVSDGAGGTSEAAVEVMVLSENDAPVVIGVIPDQVLDEGGDERSVELGPYFDDPDGDTLSFRATSSDTNVLTVTVSRQTLTLTPVEYGAATVMVTAEDPEGLTATQAFAVSVSDRLVRAVVGDTLAAMARSHLASARMTLGRRTKAGSSKRTQLTVMGRTVPLDRAATKKLLANEWPHAGGYGRYPSSVGPPAFGTAAGIGTLGATALGEAWESRMWPGEPAGRSGFGSHRSLGGYRGYGGAGVGSDRWLRGTEFALAWGGSAEGEGTRKGRRWQLWGHGDMQTFQGARSSSASYSGDLGTGYVGLDTWLSNRWLTGVAVSHSQGAGDWRVGNSRGTLGTKLTAVHPYLHWSNGTTSVSAMGGGGWGAAENVRKSGRVGTSGLGLGLGLVEARRRFGVAGGRAEFGLRGDAAWAQLATESGEETIDAHRLAVNQVRLGADVSRPVRMRSGLALAPFGEAHVRRDGGAGQIGTGLELVGGLRAARGRVRVDTQGRVLVLHSAAGYRERGVGVSLSVGQKQEGLSLSLSPRWGDSARGTGTLWQEHVYRRHGPNAGRADWGLDARTDYGMRLRSGRVLNWFGSFSQSPYGPSLVVGFRIGMLGDRQRPRERVAAPEPTVRTNTMPLSQRTFFSGSDTSAAVPKVAVTE